jgi:hypothetical protein
MRRREFVALLGGAGLIFIHIMPGNAGDGAVDRL